MKNANTRTVNGGGGSGFTLVEIMIVVVIIGLLAAMAIPAFNKVRETAQNNAINGNLRQIASAADQYFIEAGATRAAVTDIIGTDLYIKTLPVEVAGEAYTSLFPIDTGFTQLEISKADGVTVRFSN